MLLVLVVTVAAVAAGVLAERRTGEGAQRMARRLLDAMLYALLPFAAFFLIADLELTAGVRAGIGVAYAELTIVGVVAYAVATRVLRLTRPAVGAVLTTSVMANTGYLGLPLSVALLGSGALGAAVAWDTLVSSPVFLLAGFAIGAIFGDDAGTGGRQRLAAFVARNPPLLATIAGLLAPDALAPDALVESRGSPSSRCCPWASSSSASTSRLSPTRAAPASRRRSAGRWSPSSGFGSCSPRRSCSPPARSWSSSRTPTCCRPRCRAASTRSWWPTPTGWICG